MQEIQMSRKTAAYKVHLDIMAAGEVAAEAFSTFCRLLKTMRDDKLYQELEYSSFEAYCENAVGLKQRQAYNYIKAFETFGEEILQSNAKLGIRKLELISAAPEDSREKLLDDAKDMTSREVDAAIKEYKANLSKAEDELKKTKEFANKQAQYADEHMKRARDAEFKLEQKEKSISSMRSDLEFIKQQLDQAKRNGDPSKVQELGQRISDYQDQISNLNRQLAEKNQQLKDKPIEVAAARVIEKTIIPDDVKNIIYKKVEGLYEGLLALTDTEIQIFAQGVDPDYFDDIVTRISDAIGVLNNIDTAVFEAQNAVSEVAATENIIYGTSDPMTACGSCRMADMDYDTDKLDNEDLTWCTIHKKFVHIMEQTCKEFKS